MKSIEKGVSERDILQMQELDRMYGHDDDNDGDGMSDEEEEYIRKRMEEKKSQSKEGDEDDYVKDPYAKKKARLMKHQEYRTIKVGPVDLLKNG